MWRRQGRRTNCPITTPSVNLPSTFLPSSSVSFSRHLELWLFLFLFLWDSSIFLFLQICLWMNMLHFKIEFKSYIVSYMFWTETVGFYSAFVYTQDYYHCNMRKILEIWWKVNAEHMNITEYLIYSNIYKIMNIICTFQLTISSLAL